MGNSQAKKEAELRTAFEKLLDECLGNRAAAGGEWSNKDEYKSMHALQDAFRKRGMESCSLIVGIDFTKSNESQGRHSFNGRSLHNLDAGCSNPYEVALLTIGEVLRPFDDDGKIPTYIFGDVTTRHHSVKQIGAKEGCSGADGVLATYRSELRDASFSGPTSFAPLIKEAVQVVKQSGNQMHVLLILADGQVSCAMDCEKQTRDAIVSAAEVPLSIVMVGLGDGPWESVMEFDDDLPERKFDNFQFVPFTRFFELLSDPNLKSAEVTDNIRSAFALCALQELPEQFNYCNRAGLLGDGVPEPAEKRPRIQ